MEKGISFSTIFRKRYTEREFSGPDDDDNAIYSVPSKFQERGERQASRAEQVVFTRLHGLRNANQVRGLWVTFFHNTCYAGRSFRNHRDGKLIMREHDFVIFVKFKGKHYVVLAEIKSCHDASSNILNADVTSDSKVIKNNKRSAQHQLRDHLEVLRKLLDLPEKENIIQSYIMWPFLGLMTRDPNHTVIKRWKDDSNLHVFEDTLSDQEYFNRWFVDTLLSSYGVEEKHFITLLNRYIVLSCGVFVDEINTTMLALLNQEQLELLNSDVCKHHGCPLVVHGAAGTGKTLLILKKIEQLYECGQLNENNRALYICYWPGIRCEVQQKVKKLGLDKFVDTARFYISQTGFLQLNKSNYKHIFMDEAEALCLAFDNSIMTKTMSTILQRFHNGNCKVTGCTNIDLTTKRKCNNLNWGELWFLVDINQASLFLPRHSPQVLKKPNIVLSKVMRSTGYIFDIFKQFYSNPMPLLPQHVLAKITIPSIYLGHDIYGLPIYWVNSKNNSLQAVVEVIIDLCSTKGLKSNDICILPFFLSPDFLPNTINNTIDQYFVENGFRPRAVGEVETFLSDKGVNDFLISWSLKIKGLEFKVVIMVIDKDDFDINDSEDRKRTYIIASRCTCMLIIVSPKSTKNEIDLHNSIEEYPFSIEL